MPKISVIIPVYRVEQFLERCLDSVLNQTFDDWEAICINDCSPDNSGAILARYAARDKRIKVVNHRQNGGLSVARNTGMKHASGEYIMYMDSDDFIHPQTMEITLRLAQRDKSDLVCFTYDRRYRPMLMIRYKLGLSIEKIMPRRYKKKYDISNVESIVTDNVFDHVTEKSDKKIKWPIKRCQVWKFLIRRKFLDGLDFIPGIIYEDFPWWSAVILRRPRTTITKLPLYFYYPNFGTSILLSYKEKQKLHGRCVGLISAFELYSKNATESEMASWQQKLMWNYVITSFRKVGNLNDDDKNAIRMEFAKMHKMGMFNNPMSKKDCKYRDKILDFINV